MATTTVPSNALTYCVVVTNGTDRQAWTGPAEQCPIWAREMSARDHALTCSVWVIDGPDKTELETWRAGELVASRQLERPGGLDTVGRILKVAATIAALALAIVVGSPAHASIAHTPKRNTAGRPASGHWPHHPLEGQS